MTEPSPVDARLRDLVIAAERALLSPSVRRDAAALDRMLAAEFIEIGQSGRVWGRAEIIGELVGGDGRGDDTDDPALAPEREMTEIRVVELAPDTLLLTYLLRFDGRWSRRSSVWRVATDAGSAGAAGSASGAGSAGATGSASGAGSASAAARLVFHQGTTVAGPEA